MTFRVPDLSRFPKAQLRDGPSPILALPRLSRHLGGAEIYVKREDVDGLGGGGNKLRKLEFLIGEAQAARRRHDHHGRRPTIEPCPVDGSGGCALWNEV